MILFCLIICICFLFYMIYRIKEISNYYDVLLIRVLEDTMVQIDGSVDGSYLKIPFPDCDSFWFQAILKFWKPLNKIVTFEDLKRKAVKKRMW